MSKKYMGMTKIGGYLAPIDWEQETEKSVKGITVPSTFILSHKLRFIPKRRILAYDGRVLRAYNKHQAKINLLETDKALLLEKVGPAFE